MVQGTRVKKDKISETHLFLQQNKWHQAENHIISNLPVNPNIMLPSQCLILLSKLRCKVCKKSHAVLVWHTTVVSPGSLVVFSESNYQIRIPKGGGLPQKIRRVFFEHLASQTKCLASKLQLSQAIVSHCL